MPDPSPAGTCSVQEHRTQAGPGAGQQPQGDGAQECAVLAGASAWHPPELPGRAGK